MRATVQVQHAALADGMEVEGIEPVAVAGRVMAKRAMGKLMFLTLRDDRGQIQVSYMGCGVAGHSEMRAYDAGARGLLASALLSMLCTRI